MKKKIVSTLMVLGSLFATLSGCPTCVGQIQNDSPPFFSEEFYKPGTESMDDLYEQLLLEPDYAKAHPSFPEKSTDKPVVQQTTKKEKS